MTSISKTRKMLLCSEGARVEINSELAALLLADKFYRVGGQRNTRLLAAVNRNRVRFLGCMSPVRRDCAKATCERVVGGDWYDDANTARALCLVVTVPILLGSPPVRISAEKLPVLTDTFPTFPHTLRKKMHWSDVSLGALLDAIWPTKFARMSFQHRHFSPEDGVNIFLRNVSIYRSIYIKWTYVCASSGPPTFLPCQHLETYELQQNRFARPHQHWHGILKKNIGFSWLNEVQSFRTSAW